MAKQRSRTITPHQVALKMADVLRLNVFPAEIQSHSQRDGYVNIIAKTSDGVTFQRAVRTGYISTRMDKGTAVLVGYDRRRELSIVEIDFDRQIESGVDPAANNAVDRYYYGHTTQDSIQTLLCHPVADDSMEVVVRPWFWLTAGMWYESPEQRIDLSAYIPSAGEHVMVAVWVDQNNGVRVTNSTSQNILDQLDITDVQENQDAIDALADDAAPVRFWRLYGGQTGIKEEDSWRDARQIINVPESLTLYDDVTTVRHVRRVIFTGNAITDQEDGSVLVDLGGSAYDYYAFHSNESYEFDALSEKLMPVAGDWVVIEDSEDGFTKKKVDVADLTGVGATDFTEQIWIGCI